MNMTIMKFVFFNINKSLCKKLVKSIDFFQANDHDVNHNHVPVHVHDELQVHN